MMTSIAAHRNTLSLSSLGLVLLCLLPDVDGNDLMSYWPALGECEVHPCSLQKWGSERKLGFDINKDAANNNQPDLALTSGDENSLTQTQRQRKGNGLEQAGKAGLACLRDVALKKLSIRSILLCPLGGMAYLPQLSCSCHCYAKI